jgi:hypothetical protein
MLKNLTMRRLNRIIQEKIYNHGIMFKRDSIEIGEEEYQFIMESDINEKTRNIKLESIILKSPIRGTLSLIWNLGSAIEISSLITKQLQNEGCCLNNINNLNFY